VELAVVRGQYVLVSIISGHNMWPLYGVEWWPPTRGFLSTILYGDAIGTKVSGRYRQGGRSSVVHAFHYQSCCGKLPVKFEENHL
jgi:hypothetical protein